MSRLSIIVPVLNEAAYLEATLQHLQGLQPSPLEVIVVDGGSIDDSLEIARKYANQIIQCPKGRAQQMNRGVEAARGDWICFVHADTWVPSDLATWIDKTLQNPRVAGGAFVSLMTGKRTRWFTSFHNYIKTYYAPMVYRPYHCLFKGLRLLFGDQVIFCRRQDFVQVGGFCPKDLVMEEANLCLRLNRLGSLKQVHRVVRSSDRRVAHWGECRANFIYFGMALAWALRVPQSRLSKFYKDIR